MFMCTLVVVVQWEQGHCCLYWRWFQNYSVCQGCIVVIVIDFPVSIYYVINTMSAKMCVYDFKIGI